MTVERMIDRSAPVLVEIADRGRGFVLATPERPDPRSGALQAIAGNLLRQVVWQPPVETGPFPVLNLLRVQVPERSDHWCFALQGRGGPFGTAGTCQFVFADTRDWAPGGLWNWGIVRIASPLFRADADPADPWPAPLGADALIASVLRRLATGRSRIDIGDDPYAATGLLSRLLPVLPAAVIGRYLWSTCLLKQPYSAQQPAVAGGWPQPLRVANPGHADGVTAWFDDRTTLSAVQLNVRRETGLRWLAGDLAGPQPSFRPDPVPADLGALLDQAAVHQPVAVTEVASLLVSPAGLERLARNPGVVTQWAKEDPDLARQHLMAGTGDLAIQNALFDGLWAHQLCFPPAAEPQHGWHQRLAAVVLSRYRERPEDVATLVAELRKPGMPLARDADLRAAGPWLDLLGLDRRDHPELFPFSMEGVAERLRSGRLTQQDRTELLGPDGRLRGDLRELARAAVGGGAGAAADLIDVQVAGTAPERLLAEIGDLAGELVGAHPTLPWLGEVVAAAGRQSEDIRREVVRRGLRSLVAAQRHPDLPDEAVRDYAGALVGEGTDPEVSFLLDRLGRLAVPDPPRHFDPLDDEALEREGRTQDLVPPPAPMPRDWEVRGPAEPPARPGGRSGDAGPPLPPYWTVEGLRRRARPKAGSGPTDAAQHAPAGTGMQRWPWFPMVGAAVVAVLLVVIVMLLIRVLSGAAPSGSGGGDTPTSTLSVVVSTPPAPPTTQPPAATTAKPPETTKKAAQGGSPNGSGRH